MASTILFSHGSSRNLNPASGNKFAFGDHIMRVLQTWKVKDFSHIYDDSSVFRILTEMVNTPTPMFCNGITFLSILIFYIFLYYNEVLIPYGRQIRCRPPPWGKL